MCVCTYISWDSGLFDRSLAILMWLLQCGLHVVRCSRRFPMSRRMQFHRCGIFSATHLQGLLLRQDQLLHAGSVAIQIWMRLGFALQHSYFYKRRWRRAFSIDFTGWWVPLWWCIKSVWLGRIWFSKPGWWGFTVLFHVWHTAFRDTRSVLQAVLGPIATSILGFR